MSWDFQTESDTSGNAVFEKTDGRACAWEQERGWPFAQACDCKVRMAECARDGAGV